MDGGQFVGGNLRQAAFAWTPERCARLRELWAAGASGGQIAAEFGTSRCAILGKVNRLKLSQTTQRAPTATTRLRPEQLKAIRESIEAGKTIQALADEYGVSLSSMFHRVRKMGLVRATGNKRRNSPLQRVSEAERPKMATQAYGSPCSILELTATSCRWPFTDNTPHMFCNAEAAEGHSYCREHGRIAYAA